MKATRIQQDDYKRSSGCATGMMRVYKKVKPIRLPTIHQTLPNPAPFSARMPSFSPGICVRTRKDAL